MNPQSIHYLSLGPEVARLKFRDRDFEVETADTGDYQVMMDMTPEQWDLCYDHLANLGEAAWELQLEFDANPTDRDLKAELEQLCAQIEVLQYMEDIYTMLTGRTPPSNVLTK